MKRRKGRRRLSLGTVFMLLFTLLVVLGCAGFLLAITGGGMEERTAKQMDTFSAPQSMPDVQRAQQPAQAAGWVCPFCGMQNSGNFCVGCGNKMNQ